MVIKLTTGDYYKFNNKEVRLLATSVFRKVYLSEYINDDEHCGSILTTENWWKFVFNAKFLEKNKIKNSAY